MAALLREDLEARLDETDLTKRLVIAPLLDRAKQVGPGSIDLRLGSEFLEVPKQDNAYIDPFDHRESRAQFGSADRHSYVALGDRFVLHPGQFVLGSTLEFLAIPDDLVGQVLSRSSWGRLGLLVATAVAVQPGFRGVLTLELVNDGSVPIVLRPGLRVAQLQLWCGNAPTQRPYRGDGKYDAPLGPQSNRLVWEDDERLILNRITNVMHARTSPVATPSPETPLKN
jgi:dCTP deaminase